MANQVARQSNSPTFRNRVFLVTDLDNTLIDSRERFNRSIWEAVGRAFMEKDPEALDIRKLSRDQRNKFYDVFLSEKYMDLDRPVKGAVEVATRIREKGVGIVYLTGRHHTEADSLKRGTIGTLSRYGFPLPNGKEVILYMKPRKMMPTDEYKIHALHRLSRTLSLSVGVDDDPDDLRAMATVIPLTIGIAISPHAASSITSKVRVPIARDWFEVESIMRENRVI